jgi:hypothetical protein
MDPADRLLTRAAFTELEAAADAVGAGRSLLPW